MRAFLWILIVTVATLLVTALVAYPGYELAHLIDPTWKFHRIASRISMLIALVGIVLVGRRFHLGSRAALGFALPAGVYVGIGLRYFVAGVLMMLPMLALMFAAHLRLPRPDLVLNGAFYLQLAVTSVIGGLIVGLVEETFFRGFLHSAIERDRGAITAIVVVSAFFGFLHFIGKARLPGDEFQWASGFTWLAETVRLLGRPAAIFDSFLAYVAVGVVLAMVRAWMGHTAGCIGLHAGWVSAMLMVRESTIANDSAPLAFLQGSFDHFVGWLVFAWTVLIGIAFVLLKRRGLAFASAAPR